MKYPKFLKENATVGITAPSAGVGAYIKEYKKSLENIKKQNWKIIETSNVRVKAEVSSPAPQRGEEFNSLMKNQEVDAIICAKGGDFLTDMLPYIDKKAIRNKWVMGASDPTNLLYYITTSCDIATLYGHNATSFDSKNLHESQKKAINYLKGELSVQESYPFYESDKNKRNKGDYILDHESKWNSFDKQVDMQGRIIGGCIDLLRYLPGTKYDCTKRFIKKYHKDGFIWYFDVFCMPAEEFYLTLFQMKESGWFENVNGIVVGRILFPKVNTSMTYEKALKEIFPTIPIITEADIGHVAPKMTIINGSYAHVTYQNHKGKIEQFLKD